MTAIVLRDCVDDKWNFFYSDCKLMLQNLDLCTLAYVFKLLGQTVCFRCLHAKQTKIAIISAAVCSVALSNKYYISSVYWCVRLVTDLIIQAALDGYW
jgi:hypothetical protein